MSTRQFTDDFPNRDDNQRGVTKRFYDEDSLDTPDTDEVSSHAEPADSSQSGGAPSRRLPPSPEQPARPPRGESKKRRKSAHLPRTLSQVISEADEKVMQGDLEDYVPIATGFDPAAVCAKPNSRSWAALRASGKR